MSLDRARQLVKLESAERMYRDSSCYHAIVLMAEYDRRGAALKRLLALCDERDKVSDKGHGPPGALSTRAIRRVLDEVDR